MSLFQDQIEELKVDLASVKIDARWDIYTLMEVIDNLLRSEDEYELTPETAASIEAIRKRWIDHSYPALKAEQFERTRLEKPPSGLWRNDPATPEGKYLVKRRDGTVVEWPSFVLGAKDPASPAALEAYAKEAFAQGFNSLYCDDVLRLAFQFREYRRAHGVGDPDRGRHRKDDPATIAEMRKGGSA
jgi:hypothetical protein